MFDNPKRDPVCTKVSMAFHLGMDAINLPKVTAKDDAIEVKWFTTEEVKEMKNNIAFDHYEMLTYFLNL